MVRTLADEFGYMNRYVCPTAQIHRKIGCLENCPCAKSLRMDIGFFNVHF